MWDVLINTMPFGIWIYIYSAIVSGSDLRNINSKVHYWNVLSNYGIHLSFENMAMQILHQTQRLDISGQNNFIWATSMKYFKGGSSDKCSPKFCIHEQNNEIYFKTSCWSAILLCLATKVNQTRLAVDSGHLSEKQAELKINLPLKYISSVIILGWVN